MNGNSTYGAKTGPVSVRKAAYTCLLPATGSMLLPKVRSVISPPMTPWLLKDDDICGNFCGEVRGLPLAVDDHDDDYYPYGE